MKTPRIAWLVVSLAAAATLSAADSEFIGKSVLIKTSKSGSTCIRIEKSVPKVGPFTKATPDSCLFKVAAGAEGGTVSFESAAEPGKFLANSGHHLALVTGLTKQSSFRIVEPLKGKQGNALYGIEYPQFHLVITDKDFLDFARDIKEPRKATFYLEEPK